MISLSEIIMLIIMALFMLAVLYCAYWWDKTDKLDEEWEDFKKGKVKRYSGCDQHWHQLKGYSLTYYVHNKFIMNKYGIFKNIKGDFIYQGKNLDRVKYPEIEKTYLKICENCDTSFVYFDDWEPDYTP